MAADSGGGTSSAPVLYRPVIEAEYQRPDAGFTQGLVYQDGRLYESTGLYGRSAVTVYDFDDYSVLVRRELPDEYFGEGLAIVGGDLVQLTYREKLGLIYDRDTLEPKGRFEYQGQGWGLTYDGRDLVMSNGSHFLFVRDPATYRIKKTVAVKRSGRPVKNLNELEYIDGRIYANVWRTDTIVIINPADGNVVGEIHMEALTARYRDRNEAVGVLNGIAWDRDGERLLVTGKHWPHLYHISLERIGPAD